MKPLVNYCRWQRAKLRLRGRNDAAVWGELVYRTQTGEEEKRPFRFLLESAELILDPDGDEERVRLDEMGVPLT